MRNNHRAMYKHTPKGLGVLTNYLREKQKEREEAEKLLPKPASHKIRRHRLRNIAPSNGDSMVYMIGDGDDDYLVWPIAYKRKVEAHEVRLKLDIAATKEDFIDQYVNIRNGYEFTPTDVSRYVNVEPKTPKEKKS